VHAGSVPISLVIKYWRAVPEKSRWKASNDKKESILFNPSTNQNLIDRKVAIEESKAKLVDRSKKIFNVNKELEKLLKSHPVKPEASAYIERLTPKLDIRTEIKLRKIISKTPYEPIQVKAVEYYELYRNTIEKVKYNSKHFIAAVNSDSDYLNENLESRFNMN
jgi:hypothetical protein